MNDVTYNQWRHGQVYVYGEKLVRNNEDILEKRRSERLVPCNEDRGGSREMYRKEVYEIKKARGEVSDIIEYSLGSTSYSENYEMIEWNK